MNGVLCYTAPPRDQSRGSGGEKTGRLLSAAASCEEYEPVTAEIHVNQVSTNTPGDQVSDWLSISLDDDDTR